MSFTISYDIKAVDKFTAVARKVAVSMQHMDKTIRRVADSNNAAVSSFNKVGNVAAVNANKMNTAMQKSANAVNQKNAELRALTTNLNKVGNGMKQVGRNMTTYVTLPVVAGAGLAIKSAMDFNKGMANIGTMIPGQRERLEGFKKSIMSMSEETGLAADNLQGGLYQVLSSFGTTDNPLMKLELSAKMSKAGMASVMESIDLVSAVTKGYGDTSDAAARKVADMAFQAVKDGRTTFPELAASMGRVVPIAAAMGVSQQELFTGFSTLTGVTGNAAEVSTQMSAVLVSMATPTELMTDTVKKLGFASASSMLRAVGMQKSMVMLSQAVGGSTDKMAEMLGRKEAIVGALAMVGGQADVFRQKFGQMGESIGALDAAYKEQTEGINASGEKWERMKRKLFNVVVVIGDRLLPIFEKLMGKYIVPLLDKLANMDDATMESGMRFLAMAAAIGPVLTALGSVLTTVSSVISFIQGAGGLSGVLAALTGPVGIAVTAFVGAVLWVKYFWKELKRLRDAIKGPFLTVMSELKTSLTWGETAAGGLGKVLKVLVSAFSFVVAPIAKAVLWLGLLPLRGVIRAVGIAIQVFRILSNAVGVVVNAVQFAVMWVGRMLTQWLGSSAAGRVILTIFGALGWAISNVWGLVIKLWDGVAGFFKSIADYIGKIGIELGDAADKQQAMMGNAMKDATMNITGNAMTTSNSNVGVQVEILAPPGTVGDVKTKRTGSGYPNVNVGKNTRY